MLLALQLQLAVFHRSGSGRVGMLTRLVTLALAAVVATGGRVKLTHDEYKYLIRVSVGAY